MWQKLKCFFSCYSSQRNPRVQGKVIYLSSDTSMLNLLKMLQLARRCQNISANCSEMYTYPYDGDNGGQCWLSFLKVRTDYRAGLNLKFYIVGIEKLLTTFTIIIIAWWCLHHSQSRIIQVWKLPGFSKALIYYIIKFCQTSNLSHLELTFAAVVKIGKLPLFLKSLLSK